jgi:hypothetical protein
VVQRVGIVSALVWVVVVVVVVVYACTVRLICSRPSECSYRIQRQSWCCWVQMKVLWLLSIRQRFSCTVNCETEKDRLRVEGVMVMVVAAVGTVRGGGGSLFAANTVPPTDRGIVSVLVGRIWAAKLCQILNRDCVSVVIGFVSQCFWSKRSGFNSQQGPRPDQLWDPPCILSSGYWGFFLGVKRPGRDADYSPQYSAEIIAWSHTSTPPYFFMTFCIMKQYIVLMAWWLYLYRLPLPSCSSGISGEQMLMKWMGLAKVV